MTRYWPYRGVPVAYFSFWLARSFRIVPLVFLAMAFLWLFPFGGKNTSFYLYNLAFAHNFYTAQTGGYLPYTGHFWTLGVEMQFYLLFPLLFWMLPKRNRTVWLTALMVALWTITPAINQYLALPAPQVLLHAMADLLLMGAILATVENEDKRKQLSLAMFTCGLIFWIGRAISLHVAGWTPWPEALSSFLFAGLVGLSAHVRFARNFLSLPPLVFIGRISYGIYVWHLIVLVLHPYAMTYLPVGVGSSKLLMLATTMLFSVLSWYAFENPLNRIGHALSRKVGSARQ
jgi:peptidoglycan/LPS O-acetylase OafA/YrhL